MKKYLLDTCIWVDLYEDRKGFNNEPLGDLAFDLFLYIKKNNKRIIISNLTLRELETNYSLEEIKGLMMPFESILEKIFATKNQINTSKKLALERNIPKGDVLHALIAKENDLILITRDKHFDLLKDIIKYYKPEEVI